jgi:hypothetical protein
MSIRSGDHIYHARTNRCGKAISHDAGESIFTSFTLALYRVRADGGGRVGACPTCDDWRVGQDRHLSDS